MGNDSTNEYKGLTPLRFFKEDFSLSDIIKSEFLEKFKEGFSVDEAIPVSLSIAVRDDNDMGELVSFTHPKPEDLRNNVVLVDINSKNSFKKIMKVFEE